jgi:hypothetical protein
MPTQRYSSTPDVASTPKQFLVWLYNIQVKYLDTNKAGRQFLFRFGSRNCPVLDNLVDPAHMRKFITSDTRLKTFIAFMQRLERRGGQQGQVQEEAVRLVLEQPEAGDFF